MARSALLLLLVSPSVGCHPEGQTPGRAPSFALPAPEGIAQWLNDPHSEPEVDVTPDRVVIVGAGVAGLAAAVEARANGVEVVVLEREVETIGGAANAAALMLFSGSSEQAAAGITDSPEQLLVEWPDFTGGDVTDEWVRYFAEHNVPDSHDWLAGMGLVWGPPFPDNSAGSTARIHLIQGGGEALAQLLYNQLPSGTVRMGTEATSLLQDDRGQFNGVAWRDVETGETGRTMGRAVVVATGGFGWDLDRVRQIRPELEDIVLTRAAWTGSDGNGLDMLQTVGATTQNLDAVGLYSHASRCPDEDTMEMRVPFLFDVPWVNALGMRFVDEGRQNDFRTAEAIVDNGGAAWMIFDPMFTTEAFDCAPDTAAERFFAVADLVAQGFAAEGDDLAELADGMGVDPAALTADVEGYNEAVRNNGGDAWRETMKDARPVDQPPYYAMPVAVSVAKMFGGIDVDLDGQVLDTTNRPMPGLYAAGELTGMAGGSLVGDAGFTGSLSAVVLGGRVAGAHAATDGTSAF